MSFASDEAGITAVEYGLFAGLWAASVIIIYTNISIDLNMILNILLTALNIL